MSSQQQLVYLPGLVAQPGLEDTEKKGVRIEMVA
jgi:hypothetical protein